MKKIQKVLGVAILLVPFFAADAVAEEAKSEESAPSTMKGMGQGMKGMGQGGGMGQGQGMKGMGQGGGMGQGQGMKGMGQGGGMGMGQMGAMTEEQKEQHMRDMQEDMLKMHSLMNQILETEDPKEEERLKAEHLELMKAHMAKMKAHRQTMMHERMQQMRQMRMGEPAKED